MCNEFRFKQSLDKIAEEFSRLRMPLHWAGGAPNLEPRDSIRPTDPAPILTGDGQGGAELKTLRWGFVQPGRPPVINFRSEGRRFPVGRCLIPADGFYEWKQLPGEKRKQPFHITTADGDLFAFAGLWSVWHRGLPEELRSCTIITTAANSAVAPIHDRMPVILPREAEALWLAHDAPLPELRQLLGGLPSEQLALRAVGPAVNDARYDGPECLLDPPPPAQETLFGQ
jgi:putative SOS response-associated peptidase YedK